MMSRTTSAEPHIAGGPVDPDGEVVCPLIRPDGRRCLKKCTGERRYRSMQEHIRRAHPDDYLPRLSATKDSFEKMIRAAALHQSSGGIPPMGGSFTGSLGQAPISPSRGRNLALGGAEERTKSANGAWRYEEGFEHRVEDLTPPSTNSDADLPSTSTSLNSVGMSRSATSFSSFGSDTSQPMMHSKPVQMSQARKRKNNSSIDNTRRHHTFHPSSASSMQGLEPLHIPPSAGRQRKRLPQMMTSPHLSRQGTPMAFETTSSIIESDPDRTLEHDEIIRPPSSTISNEDETRTRWDELVFVASQAPEFLNQPPPSSYGYTGNTLTKSRSMADLEQRVRTTNITPPISDRRDTPPDSGTFEKMQIPSFSRSVSPRASTGMLNPNKIETDFTGSGHLGSLNNLNASGGPYSPQITITYTPRVECSGCGLLTAMGEAMACSQCIAGLCRSCVRKSSDQYMDADEAHGTCPSCTRSDCTFKAVRMRIR